MLSISSSNRHIQNIPFNGKKIYNILRHLRTFSGIDHMFGHKISMNTFKKTGIISRIFVDHTDMKLEVNNKTNVGKTHKNVEINQLFKKKIKKEIKIYCGKLKCKHNMPKLMQYSKIRSTRTIYSNKILYQKERIISIK
jgi:hypothetical protein